MVEQLCLEKDEASFEYMPRTRIAGSWGRLITVFLMNCHNDFYGGGTSLHPNHQWMIAPLTQHLR